MILAKSTNNITVYATISFMLIMLLLRNGFNFPISPTMILGVSMIPAFFVTPSQMVAMVLGFLPMTTGFQYKYALMLYLIIGLYRNISKMHVSRLVFPVLLMMLWEYAHFVGGTFVLNEFFRNFSEIIFVVFISCMRWDDIDYKVIARSFALSAVGIALVIIYVQISNGVGNFIDVLSQENVRFGEGTTEEENFNLVFNPNGLGFICNMAITALMILIVRRENSLIDIILLLLCVLCGCFTLSRTFLVCLFYLLLCFILLTPGSVKQKIVSVLSLLFFVALVCIIIIQYFNFIIDAFMYRMDTDDISNGRNFLFAFYNKHIFSSFEYCVIGIGLQFFGKTITSIYGPNILVCHNGFQEVWVVWGIVGILLFIWFFYAMIKESKCWSGKRPLIAFVPLGCMLLSSMAGQFIRSGNTLFSIVLIFMVMCLSWDKYRIYYAKR